MKKTNFTAVDALYWLGGALIAVGLGLCHLSAGLVAGGVVCLVGSYLIDRASGGGGDGR